MQEQEKQSPTEQELLTQLARNVEKNNIIIEEGIELFGPWQTASWIVESQEPDFLVFYNSILLRKVIDRKPITNIGSTVLSARGFNQDKMFSLLSSWENLPKQVKEETKSQFLYYSIFAERGDQLLYPISAIIATQISKDVERYQFIWDALTQRGKRDIVYPQTAAMLENICLTLEKQAKLFPYKPKGSMVE